MDTTAGTDADCTAQAGLWNYARLFTYNPAGAVISMQLGNGRWESTAFNSRLQPTQIALGATPNATNLLKLDYSYGTTANNGNVLSQTITVPSVTIGGTTHNGFIAVQNYAYDELNRLDDAAEYIDGSPTPSWRQDFTFDRYGNRSFVEGNTTFEGFEKLCASGTELCAELRKVLNPSANAADNRLSSSDGYVFDPAGNTVRDPQGRRFTYDGENKQVMVETLDANGNPVSTVGEYEYDGDGKRVKKHVPSTGEVTVFVYDAGGKLIGEYSTVAAPQSPKVSYTTADHLGSPRILTDENGTTISRRDFMPYGEEIARPHYGADSIRQKFTTYERDGETNLDFAQARMHNIKLGRFSSPDPILSSGRPTNPQTWGKYVYCVNNPLINVDPTGMWTWSAALGGSATDAQLRERIQSIQGNDDLSDDEKNAQISDVNRILTQREQFRSAISLLRMIVDRALMEFPERLAADMVLGAYGTENDGNGVIVAIRANEDAAAFTREENGNTIIAIAPSQFAKNTFAFTLFHEGWHAVQVHFKNILGDDFNPSVAKAEFGAYYSTASLVRALDAAYVRANLDDSGPRSYSAGTTILWQRGWDEVDMKAGVETHLRTLQLLDNDKEETSRGSRRAFPGGGAGQWK